MWETWVQSLGREDPLETGKAIHSSILAWRIPWTVMPGSKEPACQCRRHKRCWFDPWVEKTPLEEGMASHSSILAWQMPCTEEPGGLSLEGQKELETTDATQHTTDDACVVLNPVHWGWSSISKQFLIHQPGPCSSGCQRFSISDLPASGLPLASRGLTDPSSTLKPPFHFLPLKLLP